MSDDIVEQLQDLLQQATTERSHFYVAKCAKAAIAEITRLRAQVADPREKLAAWMIARSFATGHGDTFDYLLAELSWQVAEIREARSYWAALAGDLTSRIAPPAASASEPFGNDDVRNDHERSPSYVVRRFAKAILHGDDKHRDWLLEAADAFIAGKPLPPATSASPSVALAAMRELLELWPDIRQLQDGWATDDAWSEWDEQVRQRTVKFGLKWLAALSPDSGGK